MIFDADSSWGPQADALVVKAVEEAFAAVSASINNSRRSYALSGDRDWASFGRCINLPTVASPATAAAVFTDSLVSAGWRQAEQRVDLVLGRGPVTVWYHPQIRYASINVEVYSRQLCALGHNSRDR
jgi:hypothetical protein